MKTNNAASDVPTLSVGVDPCECEAYPGGLCDGWCYAKNYTNMQYCTLKRDRNRLQSLVDGASAELPPIPARDSGHGQYEHGQFIFFDAYIEFREVATLVIAKERALRKAAEETMVYQHKGLEEETTLREEAEAKNEVFRNCYVTKFAYEIVTKARKETEQRLAAIETELANWKQICLDLTGDAECLPECSGTGHSNDCPMISAANYCKSLQSRVSILEEDLKQYKKECAENSKHYNRLAGLLFSGALDKLTGNDCQKWADEYVNWKQRAEAAEEELKQYKQDNGIFGVGA